VEAVVSALSRIPEPTVDTHGWQPTVDAAHRNPSMIVIGNDNKPSHFVVVMGQDDDGNMLVYNSWGQLEAVPPENLHQEPVEIQAVEGRGYEQIWAVVTPRD
jgi:hypothetical protein